MKKRSTFVVSALAFATLGTALAWECQSYSNSRLISSWEHGTYCGSTGGGCSECYNSDGSNYCIENSFDPVECATEEFQFFP
jgi:hypothetical protein